MVTGAPVTINKVRALPNGGDPDGVYYHLPPGAAMATQHIATYQGALIPVTTFAHVHTQASPSTLWIINHNLGLRPVIKCYTPGGVEFEAEVIHTSLNQARISLAVATAGQARCI